MLNTPFPFFIRKNRVKFWYLELFSKKINFGLYFAENRHFQVGHVLLRHCDVICWPIFMILVSMVREDPTLYYLTKQLYFGRVNFKFTGRVVTTPLGRRVTKKGWGRLGLNSGLYSNIVISAYNTQKEDFTWNVERANVNHKRGQCCYPAG